jgi:glycosyltransferase involved in cell wall biosynthesis
MMRILYIGTEKSWRGGENQVRLLIQGLQHRGVTSFAAYPKGTRSYEKMKGFVDTLELSSRSGYDPRNILRLVRFCRENKIELIDANSSAAMSLGLAVKKRLPQIKLIVHRRVDLPIKKNFLTRRKYMSVLVDRFVAISYAIADVLLSYGVSKAKVSVVRSAIDSTAYENVNRPVARQKISQMLKENQMLKDQFLDQDLKQPIDTSCVWIGSAAALTKEKGHDVLIRACAELKKQGQKFYCLIAGEGDRADEFKQMARELSVSDRVHFLGHVNNVPEFLTTLDVLVMPSTHEGLGSILLEGALAGCAIVGTRVGGIPEIIHHEQTGLLISVGDWMGLTRELRRLIEDVEFRKQLSQGARAHVLKEFSLENMIKGNLAIYQSVISKSIVDNNI